RATRDWVVGHEPLNDLDAIPVRVGDEEPVARGDRRGFLRLDSAGLTVGPRGPGVGHAEGEVAWADRVRLRLLQEMELLIPEVEPEGDEVEGLRFGDFLQAEDSAVEPATRRQVSDEDGDVIDLGNGEGHSSASG